MNVNTRLDDAAPMVGQPVLRREDQRFLTGHGWFVDDVKLPGIVHLAILRSPMAHARIKGVDTTAAAVVPGVLTVVTAKDIADRATLIPVPEIMKLPGYERFPEWPLATDMVRFVGEPIAVVAAESRAIAEDAVNLIELDLEDLPVVADIDQALTDKVLVHEAAGTNLASHYRVQRGDADAAFASAHYTRKEVFRIHRHSGMPLETRGFLAQWDEASGVLTCWGANAIPRKTRDVLAGMLRLDKEKVIYVENDAGGNFGVRGHFYPEDLFVGLMAMRLKRPVKYIEDRREHILATKHSREGACEVEIAIDADGIITGMRARLFCDLGAYVAGGGAAAVPGKTAQFVPGPYKIDNYSCEVNVLITNKTPVGTYRGPGRYEGAFYCERIIDLACAELGLDPVAFRWKNLIRADQMPYKGGKLVPYTAASDYDTGDYHSTFRRVMELIDYERLKPISGKLIDGKWHGVAVCCYVDSTGMGPSEDARCVVRSPTEVEVYVGSSSSGQGIETVMAQVAADQLGLPYDTFRVFHGSTDQTANGSGHGHSRNAVQGGSAVFIAAGKLVEAILDFASLRLNEAREGLEYRAGAVFRRGEAAPLASFQQLVQAAAEAGAMDSLQASGTFANLTLTYSYGAQAAHVAVDPETATVEVLRFVTVEDIGRAINPMIVHGQTIGAAFQGLSGTFLDEYVYDEHGQILTGSLADYLVGTATDFPNIEAETLEEAPSKLNPLGVKGAGEGAISATGAVLANAVSNALASLGVQIYDLPLSPNNLSRLIREAAAGRPFRPGTGADAKFGIRYQ